MEIRYINTVYTKIRCWVSDYIMFFVCVRLLTCAGYINNSIFATSFVFILIQAYLLGDFFLSFYDYKLILIRVK